MFSIYLDSDLSLWERTASASNNSNNNSNNNSPWQHISVEFAVQQSFSAITHLMEMTNHISNSNSATSSSSLIAPRCEFNSFSINSESQVQSSQTRFQFLRDLLLPPLYAHQEQSRKVTNINSTNNSATSSATNSATNFSSQPHTPQMNSADSNNSNNNSLPHFVEQRQDSSEQNYNNNNNNEGIATNTNPNDNNSSEQQQQQQASTTSSSSPSSYPAFSQPIQLSSLITSFAKTVATRFREQNNNTNNTNNNNNFQLPRFVALLGRTAGIQIGNEAEIFSALKSLEYVLGESNDFVEVSFIIVLLPRPLTLATLQKQQQQQQNTNTNNENIMSAVEDDDQENENCDGDEDLVVCKKFSQLLKKQNNNTNNCDFFKVSVVRANDCSVIGGVMARAFLDHGK